jgi:hypothetical protein
VVSVSRIFGLGSVVFLYSVGRRLLRPHLVLQVNTHGWTYAPDGLDWTQHVEWQDIRRVALQRQRVRSKRRFLLVLEDKHHSETDPSEAVLFIELNDLFLHASQAKADGVLERIQTEFAAELDRHAITVANAIEDI